MIAGVAHSGLCNSYLGYWAMIFALLTAYVGLFGQALGAQREFSGPMSKPWRMVLLHARAWSAAAATFARIDDSGSLSLLDLTCVLIALGCVLTIAIRLKRILDALEAKSTGVTR